MVFATKAAEGRAETAKMYATKRRYVESARAYGPRGPEYQWCQLEPDGSLTFGDEHGNYAGGIYLSKTWTPGISCSNGKESDESEYWQFALQELRNIKRKSPEYYMRIIEMLAENNLTVFALEQKTEKEVTP